MKEEIYIINDKEYIDCTLLAKDKIVLKSYKSKKASELKIRFIDRENIFFKISEGNKIIFKYDGVNMFTGYIFGIGLSSEGFIDIKAYDSLRYLKNKDTYVYANKTASALIKMICDDYGLKTGEIENTKYIIPYRIEDNKSLWDIILSALELTFKATGREYVLFDDGGEVNLKSKENMMLKLCANSDSTIMSYSYKTDVDRLANRIKIIDTNTKTGTKTIYSKADSENRKKYGLLQYTQAMPRKYTGNIDELLETLLESLNKKKVTFKVKDLGNTAVRGGSGIYVYIEKDGSIISGTKIVDICTHYFSENLHTMELELQ